MTASISVKRRMWMAVAAGLVCLGLILALVWSELHEIRDEIRDGSGPLRQELTEVGLLLGATVGVVVLIVGGLLFVSRKLLRPIRSMAESAERIGGGELDRRVELVSSTNEVDALAMTLNRAFDRYNEAVCRMESFAGQAAHQLRTPLASIRSLGEVCLQRDRSPEEYRQCIADMLDVSHELTDTVNKLLILARQDAAHLREGFVPVELGGEIARLLDAARRAKGTKRFRFVGRPSVPVLVKADAALVRQAVHNVLDNAARFSPADKLVEVTLETDAIFAELRVCDRGPGIPTDIRERLVNPDACLPAGAVALPGHLGLALVVEIMRIHDGSLDIRNRDGGGACVVLRWPLA